MELDDAALVRACQQGDSAAWNTLVTRYERLIFTIARRSGLDSDEAADVYQHVFTRLVEHIDTIDRPAAIASWLIKTTQYEAWRLARRRSFGTLVDDTHVATVIDDTPSAQEQVMLLEEQHQVRTAVAALDERCRRLITLLFYQRDPLPYAEVAAMLGIPEGSIGPTRARCLQKLRHLLEDF